MSRPLPSIRGRLSRTVLVFAVVAGLAIPTGVGVVVHREVDELLDAALLESAQILHGLMGLHRPGLPTALAGAMTAPPHREDLVWQLLDPQRGVVLRSHEAPATPLVPASTRGFADVGHDWRVHAQALGGDGLVLLVAQRGLERDEARLDAVLLSAGTALLLGVLCAGWLWRRVRSELQPLAALSHAVAGFDPLDPRTGLPTAQRQELQPVHEAITGLGQRLAARLASERAFTAHAAHALRTPLAGITAQLAAAQRLSPPAAQASLARARQAADRLGGVVRALLALFRTGSELHWRSLRLAELAAPLGEALPLTIADPDEPVAGDPDLLGAALANLLDNALRCGAHRAVLTLHQEGPWQVITLSDDGPGLPEPARQALQAMLDAQRHDDAPGLGLLLADMVARAHGGRLHLLPSAAGCRVALSLARPGEAPTPPG